MKPGDQLRERYSIERSIQSGGMGALYLARDANLGQSLCAVKQMHNLGSELDHYMKTRFEAEMLALVQLQHPGIPRVRDYFQHEGSLFLVMDFIEGRTLEEELEEKRQAKQTFGAREAVNDMLQVLDVLAYMHSQNPPVLHRDIKPANLIREQGSGKIKVVDFGLARSVEGSGFQTTVGTLGYSAVEQLTGQPEVGSDVYSVGVTLHEMVTGVRPTLAGVAPLSAQTMPDFDPALAQIITRASELEVHQRHPSVSALREALQDWLQATKTPATSVPTAPASPRSPWLAAAGGVLVLGLVAFLAAGGPAAVRGTAHSDTGLEGDIFTYQADGKAGRISLGEDMGLLWVQAVGNKTALQRSERVSARLNDLYHHQCLECKNYLLEPAGIRVGNYTRGNTSEKVLFYAHMHGQTYAYGPELLATIDRGLADSLHSTPRNVAGYWRNLMRDVVALSRGEATHQSSLGPSLQELLVRAKQEQKPGVATIKNLKAIVKRLPNQQARKLQEAFLKIPQDFEFEADAFPPQAGYSPLTI
jgi:hypothetical protein